MNSKNWFNFNDKTTNDTTTNDKTTNDERLVVGAVVYRLT